MSERKQVLFALAEPILARAQAPGPPDSAEEAAVEMLRYVEVIPDLLRFLMSELIDWLGGRKVGDKHFADLSVAERENLIDSLVDDDDTRDRIALLLRLAHLVIYSRPAVRSAIGFRIVQAPVVPPLTPQPVSPPPPGPLDMEYDVCVIGSGAGGALVASRLAAAGKRILLVEEGPWVSPDDYAIRDDDGLRQSYRNAGLNLALPHLGATLGGNRPSFITIVQARVIGGGPAINNAIHLRIREERVAKWQNDYDFPFSWSELSPKLDQVATDLGVTEDPAQRGIGARSALFRDAATALGWNPLELPVATHQCGGSGACNLGCRFGRKTGGLHGPRGSNQPVSYLERFLAIPGQAVRANLRIKRLHGNFLGNRVTRASGEDLANGGKKVEVKARHFVLAAGPIASSKILIRSGIGIPDYPTGTRIAANVVLPVYAMLDRDLVTAPDPGLEMCFYVDRVGHLLETWFHYPGSLAPTITRKIRDHVAFMKSYPRLAAAGVVVPTEPNGSLGLTWDPVFGISDAELNHLKAGITDLTRLYMQAGAVQVIPATAFSSRIWRDSVDADLAAVLAAIRDPASLTLSTAHPQGGNPIGKKRGKSVVDPDFHPHDVSGLTVADASVFPAGCGVNPQMTVMALAHMAADRILPAG
jgi:choline dehydrogenase-like flavoprotein